MGMGFQSLSVYNAPPVFQTLVSQGQATNGVFAFKLAESGSELTIGGLNSALYTGAPTYTPVTEKRYWQIEFTALTIGDTAIVDEPTPAIVNSVRTRKV
jgi:cathepsin D